MPIVLRENHQASPYHFLQTPYRSLIASTVLGSLALAPQISWAEGAINGYLPFSEYQRHQVEEPKSGARAYNIGVKFKFYFSRQYDYSGCSIKGTLGVSQNSQGQLGRDVELITKTYSLDIPPPESRLSEYSEVNTEILFEILADDEIESPELVDFSNESYEITCETGDASLIRVGGTHGIYGAHFVINDASTPQLRSTAIPTRQKSLSAQLNSLRALSLHNSITRDRSIAKEIDRARKNNSKFRADNLQVRLQDQSLPVGTLLGGGAGDSAEFGRWGAFVTGNVDFGKQEKNSALESDFQTNMLIAGVDYKVSNNVVLGAALTHSDTNAGDDKTANTDFRRYSLSLFGSLYSRDKFYLDGMITYGTSAYDLDRRIVRDAGGYDTSSAKTDGDELSASLGAGYNLQHNNINARLFTFINYVDTNIDGYSENVSGNSSAAVVDGMDLQSLIANIGVELSWNINTGVGVFTPMLSIAHEHQYADDSVYVTGRFVGGLDEGKFAYTAPNRDDNYLTAQIGVNAVLPNGISGFISYDTFVDRKDFGSGQLSVGVRWEF